MEDAAGKYNHVLEMKLLDRKITKSDKCRYCSWQEFKKTKWMEAPTPSREKLSGKETKIEAARHDSSSSHHWFHHITVAPPSLVFLTERAHYSLLSTSRRNIATSCFKPGKKKQGSQERVVMKPSKTIRPRSWPIDRYRKWHSDFHLDGLERCLTVGVQNTVNVQKKWLYLF